ncbi:MAG TPA: hypothetical protein VIM55_07855 [Mucilaginibacter sp.]
MDIAKAFYYLFYQLIKFNSLLSSNKNISKIKLKALADIWLLEIFFFTPFLNYSKLIWGLKREVSIFSIEIIVPLICLNIINWIAFYEDERWQKRFMSSIIGQCKKIKRALGWLF